MNIIQVTKCDQLNGPGLRVVLWVAGCSHCCEQCHNQYSWNPDIGVPFDDKIKNEIFEELSKEWCTGITYSGGDPLFISNREEIISLAKEIREKFPNKTQWLYTGYSWPDVIEDNSMVPILRYIDVICTEKFEYKLKDVDLEWVGSSNQQIIDVKKRFEIINKLSSNN